MELVLDLVGNHFSDRQRTRGPGRGSIAAVQNVFRQHRLARPVIEHEIVHQVAVVVECLRPDAGRATRHIVLVDVGDELLQLAHLQRNQRGPGNLHHARTDKLGSHLDESREAQRIDQLRHVDVGPLVPLPAERQHRVRAQPHAAVHAGRKVYAKEGEPRVGHGSLDAQFRLERARLVVDARVDDPTVVATLVEGQLGLLLHDRNPQGRVA
uniref:Uncharacterized protein n=1 Tax=Anopheles coluzzii TaxID=1518534 RepID=A0A8W7PF91_ANOCL